MLKYVNDILNRVQLFKSRTPDFKQLQSKLTLKPKNIGNLQEKVLFSQLQYPQLNDFTLGFMNSREINGKVNGAHLAFVIGAQKVGKTTFVENNISQFKRRKNSLNSKYAKQFQFEFNYNKSSQYLQKQIQQTQFENQHYIIINFNPQKQPQLSFSSMLFKLHQQIIKQIINLCENCRSKLILNANIICSIVLSQNSSKHVYLFAKQVINNILIDCDLIYVQNKTQLLILSQSLQNKGEQYFFSQKYNHLISILSKQIECSQLQASITFFYSIAARIQYQQRPQTHNDKWWQSGIQTTDYLFDILNHLCGFGKLNQKQIQNLKAGKIGQKSTLNSYIMQGNHIDIVLSLLNLQTISCYNKKDYLNWFDHIICRLSNNSYLRKHFPIIIQLNSRCQLDQIQKMGNFCLENPIILEIPGYFQYTIQKSNLNNLFQNQLLHNLFPKLGRNPYTWNLCIQQLENGHSLSSIYKGQTQRLRQRSITLEAKFNSLYCDETNLPHLNEGNLTYHLLMTLYLLRKRQGFIHTFRSYYYVHWWNKAPFKSFIKSNILFDHYYFSSMQLTSMLDLSTLQNLQKKLKYKHKWKFLLWKLFKSPYWVYISQLKYNRSRDKHIFRMVYSNKNRPEFHIIATYFGPEQDYQSAFQALGNQKVI